jgi:hypothetical protein
MARVFFCHGCFLVPPVWLEVRFGLPVPVLRKSRILFGKERRELPTVKLENKDPKTRPHQERFRHGGYGTE